MAKKVLTLCLLSSFISLASLGCYGPFRLTKKLHKWNGDIHDKWAREGIFLVLVIVPVYGFSVLGDAIIFNSMEFWTGNNPVASVPQKRPTERVVYQGPHKAVLNYTQGTHRFKLSAYKDGRLLRSLRIEPMAAGGMGLKDQEGQLLYVSQGTQDGGIILQSAKGATLARYSPEEVSQAFAQLR